MKKLILFSIIGILLIVGVITGANYFNQKTVYFEFDANDYSVEISNNSEEVIKTITTSSEVSLSKGDYSYRVVGEGIDNTAVDFTVNESTTINVTSKLTFEKISELLSKESAAISDVLLNQYSSSTEFSVDNTQLYERGDWASAELVVSVPRQGSIVYRSVLQKENTGWVVKIPPTIAISKKGYPNVPESVLNNLYPAE